MTFSDGISNADNNHPFVAATRQRLTPCTRIAHQLAAFT
jgi:hypothetical protein